MDLSAVDPLQEVVVDQLAVDSLKAVVSRSACLSEADSSQEWAQMFPVAAAFVCLSAGSESAMA